MRIKSNNPDQISRSLLQKAVRRGDTDLVIKTLALIIKNNDSEWLSKRLAVITYEECWPFGFETKLTNKIEDIVSDFLTITKLVKNKNAAGLGSLAYELFKGDNSITHFVPESKSIRIVAKAIKKPDLFWNWIKSFDRTLQIEQFIAVSEIAYKKASWPWDKAFCLAGAYLSVFEEIPLCVETQKKVECPVWIGIDKHTAEGKIAIDFAAKKLGVNINTARWLSFNFEGAVCNESEKSKWWETEVNWRLQKLRLDYNSGLDIWIKLRPVIITFLGDEIEKLNNKLDVHIDDQTFKSKQIKLF